MFNFKLAHKRNLAKRKARFLKLDALTRAVSEILLVADPVRLYSGPNAIRRSGLMKMDTYANDAILIVTKIRATKELMIQDVIEAVKPTFAIMPSATSVLESVSNAIFWLVENEGKWKLK